MNALEEFPEELILVEAPSGRATLVISGPGVKGTVTSTMGREAMLAVAEAYAQMRRLEPPSDVAADVDALTALLEPALDAVMSPVQLARVLIAAGVRPPAPRNAAAPGVPPSPGRAAATPGRAPSHPQTETRPGTQGGAA